MAQCAFLLRGFPVFYQVGELHSGELLLDLLRNLPIDTTEHTVTVPIAAAALTAVIVLTQTAAQGKGTFYRFDHIIEGDLLQRTGDLIAALGSLIGLDNAG